MFGFSSAAEGDLNEGGMLFVAYEKNRLGTGNVCRNPGSICTCDEDEGIKNRVWLFYRVMGESIIISLRFGSRQV